MIWYFARPLASDDVAETNVAASRDGHSAASSSAPPCRATRRSGSTASAFFTPLAASGAKLSQPSKHGVSSWSESVPRRRVAAAAAAARQHKVVPLRGPQLARLLGAAGEHLGRRRDPQPGVREAAGGEALRLQHDVPVLVLVGDALGDRQRQAELAVLDRTLLHLQRHRRAPGGVRALRLQLTGQLEAAPDAAAVAAGVVAVNIVRLGIRQKVPQRRPRTRRVAAGHHHSVAVAAVRIVAVDGVNLKAPNAAVAPSATSPPPSPPSIASAAAAAAVRGRRRGHQEEAEEVLRQRAAEARRLGRPAGLVATSARTVSTLSLGIFVRNTAYPGRWRTATYRGVGRSSTSSGARTSTCRRKRSPASGSSALPRTATYSARPPPPAVESAQSADGAASAAP